MTVAELPRNVVPNSSFRKKVEEKSGETISACFQCEKCTNGCPLAFAMDIVPHKLMRSVHLGLRDEVLASDTIWVCASCETCTTRCPNNIDIAHVMDSLRQLSQSEGVTASQKQIPIFHKTFLSSMKQFGRVHEGSMAAIFTLRSGGIAGLMSMAGMGLDMFRKGKVKIMPYRLLGDRNVRDIFRAAERKG
ncbi:MAG: 4Fe-4S dicluster domain-containing protein [Chloroflexota bacterium]|nr:4Fe-4S dicluster domain-containing protein [Chloroflexota bacterium]